MSNLIKIVDIRITINSPAVSAASFDNLMIVGPPSLAPMGAIPEVGIYYDLKSIEEMGYVTTGTNADPVGAAARVAFSQTPLGPFAAIIGGITAAIIAYEAAITIISAAQKIWIAITEGVTAVQWLLNAAMSANPIGIVDTIIITYIQIKVNDFVKNSSTKGLIIILLRLLYKNY